MTTATPPPTRLRALDAFRGLLLVGVALVDVPAGASGAKPDPLVHAQWVGLHLADVVFAAFLLVSGVSLAFSLRDRSAGDAGTWWRVARRALVLIAAGLALNWLREPALADVRYSGVLQLIGLGGALASVVLLLAPRLGPVVGGPLLLGGHAALLASSPGSAWTLEGSLAGRVDVAVFGQPHLYLDGAFDPEGLVAVLSAAGLVLLGTLVGRWLAWVHAGGLDGAFDGRLADVPRALPSALVVAGAGLVGLSAGRLVESAGVPVIKQLWTASFVLLGGGWGLLALAVLLLALPLRPLAWAAAPLEALGTNALLAYVGIRIAVRVLVETLGSTIPPPADRLSALIGDWVQSPGRIGVTLALGVAALVCLVLAPLHARGVRLRA